MARDYKREYAVRSKEDRDNRQHRRLARRLVENDWELKLLKVKT